MRRAGLAARLPVPRFVLRAGLALFVGVRTAWYYLYRFFVVEPVWRAYCTRVGRRLRVGVYVPWVMGEGTLDLGDDAWFAGKCSIVFARRYADNPTLRIGDGTHIGHECSFTVGRSIEIGKHCMISSAVLMFDTPGHPKDPERRRSGAPADDADVRPIRIEDNVWIGSRSIIFPGVTIGANSVVSMNSIVVADVPADSIVAGNPARVIGKAGTRAEAVVPAAGANPESDGVLAGVMDIIAEISGDNAIRADEDIYDAGVTSIMALPLLARMEERFGVSLSDDGFAEARTAEQLAGIIRARRPPRKSAGAAG